VDSYADIAADVAGAAAFAYRHGLLVDDEFEHLLNEGLLDANALSEDLETLERHSRRDDDEPDGGELGVHLEDGALYVASELVGSEDGNVTIEELAHAIFEDPRFPARMALERFRRMHRRAPVRAVARQRRPGRRRRVVARPRARSPGRRPDDPDLASFGHRLAAARSS